MTIFKHIYKYSKTLQSINDDKIIRSSAKVRLLKQTSHNNDGIESKEEFD